MLTYTLKNGEQVTAIEIGKAKIIAGEKFNKLTILDRAPNTKSKKTRVICLCDCGQYTVQNLQDVKEGKVVSCGCFQKEVVAANGRASAKDYSSPEILGGWERRQFFPVDRSASSLANYVRNLQEEAINGRKWW